MKNSRVAISVQEIDANLPEEIMKQVQARFYHARQEFSKLKKQVAAQQAKRKRRCPWGRKLTEDNWVRRIRQQWEEAVPVSSNKGAHGLGFTTLLKIWLYAPWFNAEQNAEDIYNMLGKSALYASLCGLRHHGTDPNTGFERPAARTLRQFNQIMYLFELWDDLACWLVLLNVERGTFDWTEEVVIDPTHLDAFASVGKTCHDCKICRNRGCHFKQRTCELTGIVSKSKNLKLPGVKLNFALLAKSEIVIQALAGRGPAHDSKLLKPLLLKLAKDYPSLRERVQKILADAAFDDPNCRKITVETMDAELVTSINPRRTQPIKNPARGILEINPYGVPICAAGHEMVLSGRDHKREQYIWVCPVFHPQHGDTNLPCSSACRSRCAPTAAHGRVFRVARGLAAHIDWRNPQQQARVGKRYAKRTAVERAISRCKRILKFERFFNRGTKALQAHGDRYVIAVQLVALVAFLLNRPEAARKYRLTATPAQSVRRGKSVSSQPTPRVGRSLQTPIRSRSPT